MKKKIPRKKRRVGRPTKYTPDVLAKMGTDLLRWFSKPKNYWLKDFAHQRGMCWESILEMSARSVELSAALKTAREMQEAKLVRFGLSKKHNVAMAIFALKNVAQWRDKQEVDYTGGFNLNIKSVRSTGLKEEIAEILKDGNVRGELARFLNGSAKPAGIPRS